MLTGRLRTIEKRIARLEAASEGPREIDLHWIPAEPPGPDEELVMTEEEQMPLGWFRIFQKRLKVRNEQE